MSQPAKPKTVSLAEPNSRGELETLYRWIGGTAAQINYECSRKAQTDKWTCVCKTYMPNSPQTLLQTHSTNATKKSAMKQAATLMIKKILNQPLPLSLLVIGEDGSTTNINKMQSTPSGWKHNDVHLKTQPNNNGPVWCWQDDDAEYKPYPINISQQIDALNIGNSITATMNNTQYQIKRVSQDAAVQTNTKDRYRLVMLKNNISTPYLHSTLIQPNINPSNNNNNSSSGTYHWYWQHNYYKPFSDSDSNKIEKLNIGGVCTIYIRGTAYKIKKTAKDSATQTNTMTNFQRNVIRKPKSNNNHDDDYKQTLSEPEIEINEEPKPKPTHISYFISTPFQINSLENDLADTNVNGYYASKKNDEYVSCYVYCINYESDPYNTPLGIVLPMEINDLNNIQLPVQIRKYEEKQLTKLINEWVEEEKKLSESVRFDEKYIHDTQISLHAVQAKGGEYQHKIKKQYFDVIQKCDKFMFETLDQRTSLNHLRCNEKDEQKRFYCICPLLYLRGSTNMAIDFKFIKTIYLGSGGMSDKKLNAKEFRSKLTDYCNLKDEIVEIKNPKNDSKQIAISYGVEKRKFERIRANRTDNKHDEIDDAQTVVTLASLQSFAPSAFIQNVDTFKGLNKEKLLQKAPKADIILVRQENPVIENVLRRVKDKEIKSFEIKMQMLYPLICNVFPTGITSNLWSKLKTIPAILYRIEAWLNIIDLKQELSNIYTQEMNDINHIIPMNIDSKLLFEAMHRSAATTQMNYQIIHNFGASVLKFISFLFLFINEPTKKPTHYSKDIFSDTAKRLNLIQYAILYDFNYDKWNPAQFKDRKFNTISLEDGKFKNFPSHLLKSIIGTIFISFLQNNRNNRMSDGINGTLNFLNKCGIFSNVHKETIGKIDYILNGNDSDTNEAINQLMDILTVNNKNIKMNPMLQKSLKIVIENNEDCEDEGITFERLIGLGEVCLDLFVHLFMYESVVEHIYNDQIGDKADEVITYGDEDGDKANFSQYITQQRDNFVNNKSLAYQFVKGGLDSVILWFEKPTRDEVKTYKESIETREKRMDKTRFNINGEWFNIYRWSLQFDAPPILGQCYKALLGAIFVGSNPNIFDHGLIHWNFKSSIQFVVDFLGNQEDWKEIVDKKLKHILF